MAKKNIQNENTIVGKPANEQKNAGKAASPFALTSINYILIAVCIVLIFIGFFMMMGSSNEGATFNADVFSSRRITVAPIITLLGFVLMVPAIMYRKKNDADNLD